MAKAPDHGFSPDKVEEFKDAFDNWNTDGNAHLDSKEMTQAMQGLGVDTKKLGKILQEIDKNNDGNIDFGEFLMGLWQVKSKGDVTMFSKMVDDQVKLIAIKTASGGIKSYSVEEVTAFAKHINYCLGDDKKLAYLMPINESNLDLCKKVSDGVLLARFINMIEPDTIDWRAVNYKKKGGLNQYHIIENQNLVISAAKSIGVRIHNVSAEDLRDAEKNPILVLGFMWQAVKMQLLGNINLKSCPELIRLLDDGEDMNDLLALPPEEILKRWVNYHLAKEGSDRRIKNFDKDIKDAKVYTILMKSITSTLDNKALHCNDDGLKYKKDSDRAKEVISNAEKIGAKPFLKVNDILTGNSKLNMAFTAQLFNTCPGLQEVTQEEQKELAGIMDDDAGDSREERAFRMWINTLGIGDLYINNLFEDCRDGLTLLKVIDKIEPGTVNWKKVEKKPTNKFKKLNNCNYAIVLGKKLKLSLVNCGGADIVDRNKKLLLGFTWQLMRYHLLKFLKKLSTDAKHQITDKDVLQWCNKQVSECECKEVDKKMQIKSWSDDKIKTGKYFIYLVATIASDIVNWELVTEGDTDEDQLLNARYALSLARKIGAVIFLLPEDITEARTKMCMTFGAAVMAESMLKKGSAKTKGKKK